MERLLTQQEIDKLFTINDNMGSSLSCVDGNLIIKLAIESREPRSVGRVEYITYKGNDSPMLIYSTNEDVANIHEKLKAWGLLWEIISKVDGIVLYVDQDKFAIKSEAAKSNGKFLPHAKDGIGKLFYVPLAHWKITNNG